MNIRRLASQSALLALGCTPLSGFAAAQDPAPTERPVDKPTDKPVERLKEWPELDDEARVKRELAKLRKARTPEMGETAAVWLTELGAGCAPLLLGALGKEKNEDAQERLRAVLDAVTGAPHTRLLSAYYDHKSPNIRRWTGLRTAAFPDRGVREAAEKALAKLRKAKRTDLEDLWPAALAATAAGSIEGLDVVRLRVDADWGDVGGIARTALEGARGPAATHKTVEAMDGAKRQAIVAGLRMLSGCGDESALPTVKRHLASSDNTIRIEAINACRGILDGDPPLERLSAFDAIEVAKRWQERL